MSAIRNKQRLIHLYRYLMENTDEEHQATTNDLVEFLRQEDANASRKTVKDDIEVLIEEGIDIIVTRSFYNSYFVGSRKFEVPEIRLLVDGIVPNHSISRRKKEMIIKKLLSLLSVHQAEKIEKNLHYETRSGSLSEQLYYSIDRITDAINEHRKIGFEYMEPASTGNETGGGDRRQVIMTPVLIRSDHDHYYVCGYSEEGRKPVVFRLDRMIRTKALRVKGDLYPSEEEISRFLNSMFNMETGVLTEVTLECGNDLAYMIREKFGEDVRIRGKGRDSFNVRVMISISPSFYSWIFRYSPSIRIVSPEGVRNEYVRRVREAAAAAADR